MQKEDNDTGVINEDTEILNLPLYTERKADCIYRYRRRVPKPLVPRIGKGYLYRNLGKTKQEVVGKWPSAHAEIEEILTSAIEGESKAQELIRRSSLEKHSFRWLRNKGLGRQKFDRVSCQSFRSHLF